MDNKAVIQSRLSPDLSVADLAVPEELAVFNFDEEIVDREIMELCMKKATIEDVASIERGDFVELKVEESGKCVPATIGLGLLGKETEKFFLGMGLDGTLVPTDGPFAGRHLMICSLKRRIFSPFTDQMAAELGHASASEYRESRVRTLRSRARLEKARELTQQECLGKIAQAELLPFGTELKDLIRDYRGINQELFSSRNMNAASLDSDELEQMFGVRSIEELDEKTAESAEINLKMAIIGQKIAIEKGLTFGEPEYDEHIRAHAGKYLMDENAVRENTSFKSALVEEYVKLLISDLIAKTGSSMREV